MPSIGTAGVSLDFDFRLDDLYADQLLIDARDATGKGLAVMTGERFNLKLLLNDGRRELACESDYGTHEGTLRAKTAHHCTITLDAGPRIATFMIDGVLNDGGPTRQFGWSRFDIPIEDLNGDLQGFSNVPLLRVYQRPLLTSEAVGAWRASAAAIGQRK